MQCLDNYKILLSMCKIMCIHQPVIAVLTKEEGAAGGIDALHFLHYRIRKLSIRSLTLDKNNQRRDTDYCRTCVREE